MTDCIASPWCPDPDPDPDPIVQAFEKQLVPSVEKAVAEMFRQTDATLSAGLTEYARAAGSAATPTVKSLQAALTQASSQPAIRAVTVLLLTAPAAVDFEKD